MALGGEETGVKLAVGGEASASAVAAERLRNRGYDADLAGAVLIAIALRDLPSVVGSDRLKRHLRVDRLDDLGGGDDIEPVASADNDLQVGEAFLEALERDDLSVIVAKVKAVGPDDYGMDLELPENAFRFRRFIREKKQAAAR